MAQETIDFGAYPNDPDSDAIRVAFQKTQNNFNELFSIQYQTGVSQVLEGAGISVNQNTGNVTVTNRIANITIQTDANFKIGVTTATSNTATINSGTTPFVLNLANAISTANITATGSIRGVIASASNSQPNITSVGNLTNLSVVGNVRANNFIGNTFTVTTLNATTINSPGSNGQVIFNSLDNISASTNLTFSGTALSVIGEVSASGNINGANLVISNIISATGNIIGANLNTGTISATGNIRGANLIGRYANGTSNINIPALNGNINLSVGGVSNVLIATSTGANVTGYFDVSGNANVNNLGSDGLITAVGNITGANLLTGGVVSAIGNITGGNLITGGLISANGDITANNITIGNLLSVVGNVVASNFETTGIINANGSISSNTSLMTTGAASVSGNIIAGNLNTSIVSATGNVTGGNLRTTGRISAQGNLTANTANLGNSVTANFFIGSGANLTNISGSNIVGSVTNANLAYFSNISPTDNANIVSYIPFVNTTNGNANLIADTNLTYNANSKVLSAGALSIAGNIVAGNINVQTGTLTGRNLSTGANTNQGNITGNWVLTTGSLLSATYADLAENYAGDQKIEPGSVVEFGGTEEVRLCLTLGSTKVAGIVSTNPAYVMNSMIKCQYPITVALQGRVPAKVTGNIQKGDMMISAGNGVATACNSPIIGSVLGKALQDFDGADGIIEIAIGRL